MMIHDTFILGFLQNIGPLEWLIIAIFALVIFGKRLPDVAKSLGRSVVEFKKGLSDVQDKITDDSKSSSTQDSSSTNDKSKQ
jgi:sec-independent protein translocase protein TatA